eukprot:2420525-Karenia_brevis.AAC.1
MVGGVDAPEWVDKPQVNVDGGVTEDACSIENSGFKSWVVGAVTQTVPKHIRSRENRFENLAVSHLCQNHQMMKMK